VQLLKKQLQPHFLMNTLTAALEWLDAEPDVGVRFIEALARELQLLSDIADRPAIPLRRELALCRLHLEVMGYRQDRTFRLRTEGVNAEALVPPAIFHTLLENALTHNRYREREVHFRLRGERVAGGYRYVLRAPLQAGETCPVDGDPDDRADGTGLRYVKARLREQYGSAWALRSGLTDDSPDGPAWVTTIDIYDAE
jgi:LytS/YehU family sensor histidine kinase